MLFETANNHMNNNITKIKHIVELTLGKKLNKSYIEPLIEFAQLEDIDEVTLLKKYLQSPELVTQALIEDVIKEKIVCFGNNDITPLSKSWDEYISKLERHLQNVKYRKANNFEFNVIMPTKEELMHLVQECLRLTDQIYGDGFGNVSCFYNYFIQMSQEAGVTSFQYPKIAKYVAKDNYLCLIDKDQRREYFRKHEKFYSDYLAIGGFRARGKSAIDGTCLSNIFYYKDWQLYNMHDIAKKIIVTELNLEDYGQLEYDKKLTLWHLLQQHYPAALIADQESIFYKYAKFLHESPGEYFNYFSKDLPEVGNVSQKTFHDIVKIAGLQTNRLKILARDSVDQLIGKRCISLQWTRKYPLHNINENGSMEQVRSAGSVETTRILPNELPYGPSHGLSLCGNGIEEQHAVKSYSYEWNDPTEDESNISNWPRDIEKLFREFKQFCPNLGEDKLLPGETVINMFLNGMAYSTIHSTQHTHIIAAEQTKYLIYQLPSYKTYECKNLQAAFSLVTVGDNADCMYLRVEFTSIQNEDLLKFAIKFTEDLYKYFGGNKHIDLHIHLFLKEKNTYTLILEPHAFLIQQEDDTFLNVHNNTYTPRKPQFLSPSGDDVRMLTNNMADGLKYLQYFFTVTAMPGVSEFIENYLQKNLSVQS